METRDFETWLARETIVAAIGLNNQDLVRVGVAMRPDGPKVAKIVLVAYDRARAHRATDALVLVGVDERGRPIVSVDVRRAVIQYERSNAAVAEGDVAAADELASGTVKVSLREGDQDREFSGSPRSLARVLYPLNQLRRRLVFDKLGSTGQLKQLDAVKEWLAVMDANGGTVPE